MRGPHPAPSFSHVVTPPHPAPRSMSRGISYSLDSIKALETVIERERAELDAKVARDKLV